MLNPPSEEVVLDRLVRWGATRPDVRAMLLTSTRTYPGAPVDRFSDYDVILVVPDIAPYFASRDWLEDFGRLLVLYRDPLRLEHGLEKFAYITQYEDGLKIDFTLWPVELLRRVVEHAARAGRLEPDLDGGYRLLLDKDGLAEGLPDPAYRAYIPSPPDESAYLELVEVFFHEATYVAKHLWRGDLLPAKYNLDQAMKQCKLRTLLEWRVELDYGWSVKPGAYGKGLHAHLPDDLWARLERTYVGAGREENWQALFATLDLFRDVAIQVGGSLGFAYPHELHARVVSYLQRVQALPPKNSDDIA